MTRINEKLTLIPVYRENSGGIEEIIVSDGDDGEAQVDIVSDDIPRVIQALAYYAGSDRLAEILTTVEALMPPPTSGTATSAVPDLDDVVFDADAFQREQYPNDLDTPDIDPTAPLLPPPIPAQVTRAQPPGDEWGPPDDLGPLIPTDPPGSPAAIAKLVDATTGQPVDLTEVARRTEAETRIHPGPFHDQDAALEAARKHAADLVKARAAAQAVTDELAWTPRQQELAEAAAELHTAVQAHQATGDQLRHAADRLNNLTLPQHHTAEEHA